MIESENCYEVVIKSCKQLETILEKDWQAEGRGLGEKVTSVSSDLPRGTVHLIYKISGIRNKLVHEDSFELSSLDKYVSLVEQAKLSLETLANKKRTEILTVSEREIESDFNNQNRIVVKKHTNNNWSRVNVRKVLFYIWIATGIYLAYTNPSQDSMVLFLALFMVYLALAAIRKVLIFALSELKGLYYWLLGFFL